MMSGLRKLPKTVKALHRIHTITSADIVVVITRSSGAYDRPEDLIGTWFAFILGGLTFLTLPTANNLLYAEMIHWKLLALLSAIMVGLILGAMLARHFRFLQQICYSQSLMTSNVAHQSKIMFANNHPKKINRGIMIYISLFEKTCTVLADKETTEEFSQLGLDVIAFELTGRLANQDFDAALGETVISAGSRLKKKFPPSQKAEPKPLNDILVII